MDGQRARGDGLELGELVRGARRRAELVERAVDGGRRERVRRRGGSRGDGSRPGSGAHALARAGHQRAAGLDLRGDVAAERPRRSAAAARGRRTPAAWAASRSTAAASPEPPPMPAATGTRLAIVMRCGGASQPVASRKRASAVSARFGPSTPGQTTSSRSRRLHRQLVGERHRLHDRHQRVQAVGARRADVERQVDLAGREAAQPHRSRCVAARATRSGASASARAFVGQPMLRAAPRAARRGRRPPSDTRARERLAAVGEALLDERAQLRAAALGRARSSRTRTESTLGTGKNTFLDTGRITFTSHASWASTDGTP